LVVITISGKAEAGKSEFANQLTEILTQLGRVVITLHFAEYLKITCLNNGWNGEKDEAGRELLQKTGAEIRRKEPDFFVDKLIADLRKVENDVDYVLIPDTRFTNEIENIKKLYKTISVWVHRVEESCKPYINSLTSEQKLHESETSLDAYLFDVEVLNVSGRKSVLQEDAERMVAFELEGTEFGGVK